MTSLPNELQSPLASERRSAIRALPQHLTTNQLSELRSLRASESDAWVRRAMDRHLSLNRPVILLSDRDELVDDEVVQEIREQARAEVADLVVHELRHAALRIELAAEAEVVEYGASETKKALDVFRRIATSLAQLAASGRPAHPVEVSMSEVVYEASSEFADSLWPPEFLGPDQIVVDADPGLLHLAIANALRNGIESSAAAFHSASPVFVTWGRTDRDAWIAVYDDGVGLDSPAEELFEAHRTTKGGSSHAGLGLTIARNALRAMGGDVRLENRAPRGAVCELRWPQGRDE